MFQIVKHILFDPKIPLLGIYGNKNFPQVCYVVLVRSSDNVHYSIVCNGENWKHQFFKRKYLNPSLVTSPDIPIFAFALLHIINSQ